MTTILLVLAFAFFVVGAYLTPDRPAKAVCIGLALLTAAMGLTR